jgi:hypothetical protein
MLTFKNIAMKINKIIAFLGIFSLSIASSCSPEDDIVIPNYTPTVFAEDFAPGAVDNTILDTENWSNIAEVGTAKWKEQVFSGNAYAEFSSFQTPDAVSIGWLISPKVDLGTEQNKNLIFRASQSFVSSSSNSLEVLIATDYDGTNLTTANWQNLTATLPTTSSPFFEFIYSGEIDLSTFTGNVNFAFKVKGSGTNTALDGSYQIDDVNVILKK